MTGNTIHHLQMRMTAERYRVPEDIQTYYSVQAKLKPSQTSAYLCRILNMYFVITCKINNGWKEISDKNNEELYNLSLSSIVRTILQACHLFPSTSRGWGSSRVSCKLGWRRLEEISAYNNNKIVNNCKYREKWPRCSIPVLFQKQWLRQSKNLHSPTQNKSTRTTV